MLGILPTRNISLQCGVKVTGVYLVQINSDYVRGEELNIQELFIKTDMAI